MAHQSTQDDTTLDTNAFYRRTMHVLSDAQVPFLVGGSHAFLHYTGIVRDTKDFDLFVRASDAGRALSELADAGYRTECTFPHWLGKAISGSDFVDMVFNSGNGICRVDDLWFEHAVEAQVLGMPVKLVPAEELLWQKAFVMERERFDGADIAHIIRSRGRELDWTRLLLRFEPHWQLLLTYLVYFHFVFPSDRNQVPAEVVRELTSRLEHDLDSEPPGERICQGTLLSRSQYMVDIGRLGYRDARLAPLGNMSAEEVVYWTWAIGNVK